MITAAEIPADVLEAACRAHWKSWGKMRPDVERAHRDKMRRALVAAFNRLGPRTLP